MLPLFEIGVNPNVRILIISDVLPKASARTEVLREHIEKNAAYREIFPHIRIVSKKGDEEFTVERDRILKEPTVLSTYAGGPISGQRFDIVIADDLVSYLLNSTTTGKRGKLRRWWEDEVMNSVAKNGVVWVIGTRQHHDDLYETIKSDEDFRCITYPAWDEEGVLGYREKNEVLGITGDDTSVLWSKMHDFRALMAKRRKSPDSFARQQQQVAIPETGLVYRRELVDAALERGKKLRPDPQAAQFLALDPGYGKRAALLAIQERAGDRIEMWGEYSFTHIDDDGISRVVVDHVREYGVRAIYVDAEDPGLAAAIVRDLESEGLRCEVIRVPFAKYKRLAIKATRWLLESGRLSWKAERTTVYRPERVTVEKSIFRREVRDYALDPNNPDDAIKDNDHGPDAFAAYAAKWIEAWAESESKESIESPKPDRALRSS